MSSSVIGSAHAPAWLEPVEDPPRRAARTARLARRAVAGDARDSHRTVSSKPPQTDDTRHVDTAAGVTRRGAPPRTRHSISLQRTAPLPSTNTSGSFGISS